MTTPLTFDRSARGQEARGYTRTADTPARHQPDSDADSTSIRWVFAATVLFWVVVYAAGRSFF